MAKAGDGQGSTLRAVDAWPHGLNQSGKLTSNCAWERVQETDF